MPAIERGDYVHVVATVDLDAKSGKILYVNPANTRFASDAVPDGRVELVAADAAGKTLVRAAVIPRYGSCEEEGQTRTGLVQADLPRIAGMKSLELLIDGASVSRYEAGAPPPPPAAPARRGLGFAAPGLAAHRRPLTLHDAATIAPMAGVTYSVQVKPDTGGPWNTIAVGSPTPHVEIDRNQFAGAKTAEVRILRTTGFEEEVLAEDVVELF